MEYKAILVTAMAMAASAFLVGCGGGGSSTAADVTPTELEGTWLYSSNSEVDLSTCRIDLPGRSTGLKMTISGNRFFAYDRTCIVLPILNKATGSLSPGFLGSFIDMTTPSSEGTISIGGIYVQSNDPSAQMRAIDFISSNPKYNSYHLSGNKLTIATPSSGYDGSSPSKRMFFNSYPTINFFR